MPLYDLECERCERFLVDVFFTLAETPTCSYCHAPARVIISPVRTIGPMPSKPLKMPQIGKEFTSNSQWRDYQQAHPEVKVVDKSDLYYDKFYTRVREKADKAAKKLGYSDHEDRGRKRKAEKMKEASLTGQK